MVIWCVQRINWYTVSSILQRMIKQAFSRKFLQLQGSNSSSGARSKYKPASQKFLSKHSSLQLFDKHNGCATETSKKHLDALTKLDREQTYWLGSEHNCVVVLDFLWTLVLLWSLIESEPKYTVYIHPWGRRRWHQRGLAQPLSLTH